jgi:hypothetical protein
LSAAAVAPPTKANSWLESHDTIVPLAFASSAPTCTVPMRRLAMRAKSGLPCTPRNASGACPITMPSSQTSGSPMAINATSSVSVADEPGFIRRASRRYSGTNIT